MALSGRRSRVQDDGLATLVTTIFVLDDELAAEGAFGVTPGNNIKEDFGALINASLNREFAENLTWKARANAFMRYNNPDLWVVTIRKCHSCESQ